MKCKNCDGHGCDNYTGRYAPPGMVIPERKCVECKGSGIEPIEPKVGMKLTADWGAMFPTSRGEIIKIDDGTFTVLWDILGDEENVEYAYNDAPIRPWWWRSANGSGIGIFLDEEGD